MKTLTLEETTELYEYLQGESMPDTVLIPLKRTPNLTPKKAFQVIWFLQEHLRLIPDTYEQCWNCKGLFDTNCSGIYWETKERHYCDGCEYLVPYNYDKGRK
jgi:hypothetical protein